MPSATAGVVCGHHWISFEAQAGAGADKTTFVAFCRPFACCCCGAGSCDGAAQAGRCSCCCWQPWLARGSGSTSVNGWCCTARHGPRHMMAFQNQACREPSGVPAAFQPPAPSAASRASRYFFCKRSGPCHGLHTSLVFTSCPLPSSGCLTGFCGCGAHPRNSTHPLLRSSRNRWHWNLDAAALNRHVCAVSGPSPSF